METSAHRGTPSSRLWSLVISRLDHRSKVRPLGLERALSPSPSSYHHVDVWYTLPCDYLWREPLRLCWGNYRWVSSGKSKSLIGNLHLVTENYLQGLKLSAQDVQSQLSRRRPGQSNLTTPVGYYPCLLAFKLIFDNSAMRRTLCTFSPVLNTALP